MGDSVNGILLGHPFTRTRRKLEDLIWRAVWIAFALAMPPIEPSVIYVHIHTYYAHLYTDRREYEHASVLVCVYTRIHVRGVCEGAVYTKTQFIRSFARRVYTRAHVGMHIHVDALTTRVRTYVFASMCASSTYVWVLTFHDLSRSFQRASKRPESAQIDKRNNRGREIEGLDLI